jgi:hypothetical protein
LHCCDNVGRRVAALYHSAILDVLHGALSALRVCGIAIRFQQWNFKPFDSSNGTSSHLIPAMEFQVRAHFVAATTWAAELLRSTTAQFST